MWKLSGLCLLLAALSRAVAGDKVTTAYFADGGELTLDVKPSYPEPITNILWKFKGNLLAEWVKDKVPLELYGTFDGRAKLDLVSARLVIKRMSKADAGKYTVGINSKVHGESYDAQWLGKVGKPTVVVRTLTCAPASKSCTVSCEADTKEAGPVTYGWKFGEKEWEVSEKDVEINQTDYALDKTITCRISNLVSEQVSDAIKNPLYNDKTGPIVAGVLIPLLVLCGVVVGVFFMRKRKKFCFKDQNSTKPDPTPKQPDPTLNKPDPTLNKPDPTLNKPDPTPNKPDPTTPVPEGDRSDPAAAERVPLCQLQDCKETV